MNGLLSALGSLDHDESACIQILLRPVDDDWQDTIKKMIRKVEKHKSGSFHFSLNPFVWLGNLLDIVVSSPEDSMKHTEDGNNEDEEPVDEEGLMKEKIKKTGYATTVRIVVTGNNESSVAAELV
jgi:hypothetical protein